MVYFFKSSVYESNCEPVDVSGYEQLALSALLMPSSSTVVYAVFVFLRVF